MFLRKVDNELDSQEYEIEETLPNLSKTHKLNIHDEVDNQIDMLLNPTSENDKEISVKAKQQVNRIKKRMAKVSVAPGEFGSFKNWGDDVFLEEKIFPEKFPYGTGGYLSSVIDNPDNNLGFANYCVNQIMSCDPKFRNDSTYLFFLLLVKELIMLKRCKSTYLRQATKLPNLTRNDVLTMKHENLSRFNRSFEVFKNMRGTSMYYEESKKNLFAHLRQNGCPTLFFTLSCAEFNWADLLKEIIETVYRKKVNDEDIEKLSTSQKNKLISENYVQTTLHFQKRIEKLFTLMQYDDFFGNSGDETYHMSSYFYRIEFQQRGAPHVHSLLWIKDSEDNDAPSFWIEETDENPGKKRNKFNQTQDSDHEQNQENINARLCWKKGNPEFKILLIF